MKPYTCIILIVAFIGICSGCNSSTVDEALDSIGDADELAELLDGVERRPVDASRLGVNAFANQSFAGGTCEQFNEIAETLKLRFVRVLFSWIDAVQPSPDSTPNFGFFDEIITCIPPGVDALVILTNVPSWMRNPENWEEGNPRLTFARRWARRVASRYAGNPKIVAFQVWNEPDNGGFTENEAIQVLNSPENFVELVALSSNLIKDVDPSRRVINGATTGIAQNFPDNLDYNKAMVSSGILDVVDFYGIHYYGTNFERLVTKVEEFLNTIPKPIWVTESGIRGVNKQLEYAETVFPFLRKNVPSIDRIYWYRFAENSAADSSYGLRTSDPNSPVSDFYISLSTR